MPTKPQITVATTAGFCPGVKNAIDKVLELAKHSKKNIYTLGPLIHNRQVIETLEEKNIRAIKDPSEIKDPNSILVIRAHGVPPEVENSLKSLALEVVDATCPLVKHVHKTIDKYAAEGYATIIVGDRDHAEVVGLMGYTRGSGHVVSGPEEMNKLPNFEKANIVAQTTQEEDVFLATAAIARKKIPELIVSNTICKPTKDRQKETVEFSKRSDLVIIVGGKNSANTARLFQICAKLAPAAIHIEKEDEITAEILKDKSSIFITAGASTPSWMIEKVLAHVRDTAGERKSSIEDRISFVLKLIIASGAYTALSAAALTYVCMKLEGAPISEKILLMTGLFVLSLHMANRAQEKGAAAPDKVKHLLFIRFKSATKMIAFTAGALALALSATLGYKVFLPATLLWTMGMLYPYKMPLGFEKFTNFPASKDILTALGWGFVCAVAPGIWNGSILYKSTHLAITFAIFLVFMRSVMFGICHAHSDMIVGKENFYKAAGAKLTYLTLFAIFISIEVILLILKNMHWKPGLVAALFTGLFYYMALILFFYFSKIPERGASEALIDSQFILLSFFAWHTGK